MSRVAPLSLAVCLVVLMTPCGPARAADPPDLSKIRRRVTREPAYVAKQRLYVLYVFGPWQAKTHVWAVLDKSKPDAPHYDVLYFDRNADGDLTAPNERIQGHFDDDETTFDIGSFTDPLSKAGGNTNVSITPLLREKNSSTMLRISGVTRLRSAEGMPPKPGPIRSSLSRRMRRRSCGQGLMAHSASNSGSSIHCKLVDPTTSAFFWGTRKGSGKNTFCAVPDTFLPKDIPVIATLIYRDKDGHEHRARSELFSLLLRDPVPRPRAGVSPDDAVSR